MGWSGGGANRTWKRGQRGADDGRVGAAQDIARILAKWRADHGWEPGYQWDPRAGHYAPPASILDP